MLVLLCAVCCDAAAPEGADSGGQELVCELCQRRRRQEQEQAGSGGGGRPPLRVLCLHGFRQTASSLHGRTAALRKRLRGVAEFVFADGPHALPLLLAPGGGKTEGGGDGRSGGVQQARPRRAWLITPEQHAALHAPAQDGEGAAGAASELGVDEAQRQRQTAGWAESGAALRRLLEEQGPFDGVMGFSQGAAVAAALCALQQGEGQGEGEGQVRTQGGLLKFAILCSGYLPAEPALRDALARARAGGGAPLPSLHVHAGGGAAAAADGQVAPSESQALAECFDPRRRAALLHSGGHVIPSSRAAAQRIRHFLEGVP
jgi:predicted esterase